MWMNRNSNSPIWNKVLLGWFPQSHHLEWRWQVRPLYPLRINTKSPKPARNPLPISSKVTTLKTPANFSWWSLMKPPIITTQLSQLSQLSQPNLQVRVFETLLRRAEKLHLDSRLPVILHRNQRPLPQNLWANYNNSLTWIKAAIWGWFPLLIYPETSVVGWFCTDHPSLVWSFWNWKLTSHQTQILWHSPIRLIRKTSDLHGIEYIWIYPLVN